MKDDDRADVLLIRQVTDFEESQLAIIEGRASSWPKYDRDYEKRQAQNYNSIWNARQKQNEFNGTDYS